MLVQPCLSLQTSFYMEFYIQNNLVLHYPNVLYYFPINNHRLYIQESLPLLLHHYSILTMVYLWKDNLSFRFLLHFSFEFSPSFIFYHIKYSSVLTTLQLPFFFTKIIFWGLASPIFGTCSVSSHSYSFPFSKGSFNLTRIV